MDYFDILKKALTIAWKYKALWVLGFFVGAGGSSGGSSGGTSSWQTSAQDLPRIQVDLADWPSGDLTLIAVVAGVLVAIGLVLLVVNIAAQGGLVYGTNAAAEDRKVPLGECWRVGFSKWGRTFMIGFMLALPILVLVGALVAVIVTAVLGGTAVTDGGIFAAIGGICLFLPVFFIAVIALSFAIGVLQPLALRYGILRDITFGQAIKRAWDDLWGKKGAVVFLLVMILPSIAYGFATMIIVLPFAMSVVFLAIGEAYVAAASVGALMVLVLMVPGAFYATFHHSAWTVFFRRMTGMEEQPDRAVQYGATDTVPSPPIGSSAVAPQAPASDTPVVEPPVVEQESPPDA
jgi:hypothetical protein